MLGQDAELCTAVQRSTRERGAVYTRQLRNSILDLVILTVVATDQLEDTIADCIEVWPTADAREQSVDKVLRMLRLSDKIKVDASLARQLKRKFAR